MILKRLFDVVFSIIALTALVPLFIVVAIWIKIDSIGPVFYRQVRVGKNEKPFKIFKFRTMYVSEQKVNLQITVSKDPRITKVGAFLRKYKIDELAQFLNVLLGQMSVVGPRPEVPHYVEKYPNSIREKIFSIRPGITDKASIEFRNENQMLDGSNNPENMYIEKILPIKLKYYSEYVDDHSMLGDIYIILRTLMLIF